MAKAPTPRQAFFSQDPEDVYAQLAQPPISPAITTTILKRLDRI